MIALKLAYKNLMGAGLRTWLNVAVLSFAFVLIIFYNGMIDGWHRQGIKDTQEWETGAGQFWHPSYDRYDAYTFQDAHAPLSDSLLSFINTKKLAPVLLTQGTAYPQGRMQGIILKGIDPKQTILKLPTSALNKSKTPYAAFIGKRMAKTMKTKQGDQILVRWRDKNGTFDARELTIVKIFDCDVPSIDNGQLWLSLGTLQTMMNLENEATYLVCSEEVKHLTFSNWDFKDSDFLLAELRQIIQSEKGGAMVLEGLLLIIALLAIFDTQVLSIFRRQKEIGTYIALGLTRKQVVGIFTIEGGAHSILAAILGAIYGIPLFLYLDTIGITFGGLDTGITMAETIYPYYSIGLIISTLVIVVLSATIVSYIPAKKISKMRATDALKGKIQ